MANKNLREKFEIYCKISKIEPNKLLFNLFQAGWLLSDGEDDFNTAEDYD